MIEILLVDDHSVVRSGLKLLLNSYPNFNVIGEASDGQEAIDLAIKLHPNLIIMDLSMPLGKDGLSATREIKKLMPDTQILILTMHDDDEYLYRALQLGASGCILKSALHQELIIAIEKVANGEAYLYPTATQRLVGNFMETSSAQQTDKFATLSDREQEVLTLVVKGFANKAIAEKLYISVKTVEAHKSHVMDKLELKTRPELVEYVVKKGLLVYDS